MGAYGRVWACSWVDQYAYHSPNAIRLKNRYRSSRVSICHPGMVDYVGGGIGGVGRGSCVAHSWDREDLRHGSHPKLPPNITMPLIPEIKSSKRTFCS